jgi:hypothetical protein
VTYSLFMELLNTPTDFRGLSRMTLLLLAAHATGPNEEAEASAAWIAEQLDCTDRAVRNCLNAFAVTGAIRVVDGGGGRGNTKRIQIVWRAKPSPNGRYDPKNTEPQTLNVTPGSLPPSANTEPQTLNMAVNTEPQTGNSANPARDSLNSPGFGEAGYINSSTVGRAGLSTPFVEPESLSTVSTPLSPLSPSPPAKTTAKKAKKYQRGDLKPLDDDARAHLHSRWDTVCGGVESVDDQISLALAYESVEKYTDIPAYVNNWLRTFATRQAQHPRTNGHVNTSATPAPSKERYRSAIE